ncbi:FAD-binding protein [Nocardia sp. NEAU-G5]|uniref:FAD-binding protein n=1 Tax=Nocardia albiluteola TaxID=2842303 RepID=A0ABS6B1J9_9NOCA|nr:FAD-binding protein [Nocardia albiluteola]MBU3063104.1 FAD-binding protein [Nocardia albiluteola]
MSTTGARERGTAVVIGGGLAGMLAAWALRGAAQRVIVVERDVYPDQPVFRPGVPQSRHAHLLLEGGHRRLEQFLPGVRSELLARGAVLVAMSGGLRWLTSAGPMAEHHTDLAFLSCPRPLLDHVVRSRVWRPPSRTVDGTVIEVVQGAEVVGLLGSDRAVTGVRIRRRGRVTESRQPAELVVDASGRGTRLPRWLAALGCAPLPVDVVDAGVAYTSRIVHRPPDSRLGYSALYVQATREQPRTGAVLPISEDQWIISLGGMRGHEPDSGAEGFATMLAQLQEREPLLEDMLHTAEPVGEVWGFRPGPSVRRHLEAHNTPDGLIALGDAHTCLNPVYGQGMSTTIDAAIGLRAAAQRHRDIGPRTARAARAAITAASAAPWMMSTAEDGRYKGTINAPTGPLIRAQHRYLDQVLARATTDPRAAHAFERVMSLIAPPASLFRPSILVPIVLRH